MGIQLQDEDISAAHCLPTYNKSVDNKIAIKFTCRSVQDGLYRKSKYKQERSSLAT